MGGNRLARCRLPCDSARRGLEAPLLLLHHRLVGQATSAKRPDNYVIQGDDGDEEQSDDRRHDQ